MVIRRPQFLGDRHVVAEALRLECEVGLQRKLFFQKLRYSFCELALVIPLATTDEDFAGHHHSTQSTIFFGKKRQARRAREASEQPSEL